jgi:DNA-binding transcriptional LysR family regulator
MDLRRLAHLVALADARSFARAAKRVHLSQPALTRSVQAAEREWGMQLFERSAKEVTLTPAGAFAIERARALVYSSASLDRDVQLFRDRRIGDVAFGVGPFPASTILPQLLVGLRKDHPQVNVRVEISSSPNLTRLLCDEEVELFIADARGVRRDPTVSVHPVGHQLVSFYCRRAHPLAGGKAVRLRDVWEHGLATVRLPSTVAASIGALLGVSTPSGRTRASIECDDITTLVRVALRTDTVLAAPDHSVERELARGALVRLNVRDAPHSPSDLAVVTLAGRVLSPTAELVVTRVKALVAGPNP